MRALLVRVGVDQAYGKWNGPVDPGTNEFVYVAIPDKRELIAGLETPYTSVVPALAAFTAGRVCKSPIVLPEPLRTGNMHLDPDFSHLTYGDTKDRARELAKFAKDDLVVFYAGLRPCRPCPHRLIYAIIGLYRVDEVVRLDTVPKERWRENAHTRRANMRADDIIVRGQAGVSGRLKSCIPIGEWRDGAYRVTEEMLDAWGGLSCKDGFIQRSTVPPEFLDPSRFLRWFENQKPELVAANNPGDGEEVAPVSSISARKPEPTVAPRKPKVRSDRDAVVHAAAGVIVVMLRRPRKDDARRDPYFEFGSFGLTGCHQTNLLADTAAQGRRLAFAQGGPLGFRLVMLTPAVDINVYSGRREASWDPAERPLRYQDAPLLIAGGASDEPMTGIAELHDVLKRVDRSTWEARFASAFRSRKKPVGEKLGAAITRAWDEAVAVESRAEHYWETLPGHPTAIEADRHSAHTRLLAKARGDVIPDRPGPRRDRAKRSSGRRC